MKKQVLKLIKCVFIIFLLFGVDSNLVDAATTSTTKTIENLKKQVQTLTNSIKTKDKQIATLKSQLESRDKKIKTQTTTISTLNTKIKTLEKQIASSTTPNVSSTIAKPVKIVADDRKNTYLGVLTTNIYDSDSVFNEFGNYGSKFSQYSIWNEFGSFGSQFSSYSAFNEFTSTPPLIIDGKGKIIGKVTVNQFITGGVKPNELLSFAEFLGL